VSVICQSLCPTEKVDEKSGESTRPAPLTPPTITRLISLKSLLDFTGTRFDAPPLPEVMCTVVPSVEKT